MNENADYGVLWAEIINDEGANKSSRHVEQAGHASVCSAIVPAISSD